MIGAYLHKLHDLNLVHSPESRKLLRSLEETLCQIHMLFKACQKTRITYHFSGGKLAGQLREVQGKIGVYLIAFPSIIQVYMACQFARAAGHAHVAEVQEQLLLSESPQRMEEGPPPPSISVAAFYVVLNKAFSYLESYGMGKGMEILKGRLFKRMEEIQGVNDWVDTLEIKAKSTVYCTWIWPLRDAIEEVEAAVDCIEYDECERATRAQKVQHKVRYRRSSIGKGKNIRSAKSGSGICMTKLRNALLDLDEVATDAYLYFYHETRYTSEKNHGLINNMEIGLIGRATEKERIVCWLTQPESLRMDNGLSVFAVHGKGGMGKTALVRLVYREEEVMESFDSMIWLHIPKNFDAGIMTQRIVESVANWRFSYNTLEDLQKILISEMSTKKFLLILDGAQDGDRIDEWERLMAPLRYGKCGSKIVLTTQELSVVNVVAELAGAKPELLPLSGLSYDESLTLFRKHAFASLDPEITPEIIEEKNSLVIRTAMERFEGCPLLIKALAGYLGENFRPKIVNEIIMLLKQKEYSADCLLKLLYHGLPSHIQACFRYFSIFPREHKFNKEDLVKFWMGSGLIPEDSYATQRPEDIGKVYIDTLVRRSFLDKIMEGNSCAEYQEYYVLPTSMHELAQHFSLGECARIDSGSIENVAVSIRHLYIAQHEPLTSDSLKVIPHLKYLRTLIVEGRFRDQKAENMLGEILKGLKFLRLLKLPRTSSILNEVFNLAHLRYISLFKCGRTDLCKVFKLYHLRLLELHHVLAEAVDFEGITNLQHLRYLDLPEHCYPNVNKIGYLSELQELDNFVITKTEGCEVSTLENLLQVRRLGLQEMENVVDCQDVKKLKLKQKTKLKSLSLAWSTHLTDTLDDQIFNNLEPPTGLEELHVMGYSGHIPTWMVEGSLLMLVYLEIKNCMRWESIPSLRALQFLKQIRLEHLSNLRCIGSDFEVHMESDTCVGTFFPPSLEILTIELCPKLKRLPKLPLSLCQLVLDNVGLEAFPEIELIVDSQQNESSSSLLQSNLVLLHAENCSDLASLNEGLLQQQEHLGSLQKVVLKNCENLEHLPLDGFSALVQLKYIRIVSCPVLRMKRDVNSNLFPLSLKYFDIRCCADVEVSMLTSMQSITLLRRLSLFDCDNLKKLPSEEVFKALGMLNEVSIIRCKNLLSLGGLGAAESLRLLTVVCCEKLEVSDAVSNKESCSGCSFELDMLKISHQNLLLVEPLLKLQSTKELHICNDDRMTHLSKNWLMNNCASLRSIVIGVADSLLSLPSWLVELEKLQFLHINRCFLIDSIPEMPSSLRKLTIWGCHPLLLDRCQKDIGTDWPKIAKIDADLQASTVSTE